MKRRCEESVPLLGPWLDGELAVEDRAWVAEHVAECDACAQRRPNSMRRSMSLRVRGLSSSLARRSKKTIGTRTGCQCR